jgi:hypothetical protein
MFSFYFVTCAFVFVCGDEIDSMRVVALYFRFTCACVFVCGLQEMKIIA